MIIREGWIKKAYFPFTINVNSNTYKTIYQ